jgi:RHS repeat-associated protein
MAALAPITNETPAWDVLDPFPESHARARQTKSGNPLSKSLTYSYDAVDNRRSLDAPDSGRFSYVYDAADQLSSVLNPFSELTTFSYDIAGRRTVQRYSNGTRASIIYDTANNVTQFHNRTSTGTAITTNDYKYDNVGNRTGMLEASGDRLTWTYDNGDQLKSERRSGASGYANTFTYDGVGNRTLKNAGATRTTFSYDIADQLVYSQAVAGRTSYVYDNAGNQQIERPPTGSRTTTVWDNENRPTLYRLPDTSLVTMSYNGNNRRVTKQSATETVKFVWDPAADAYLAEFNGSNVLQATYSHEPVQFGRALSQRRSTTSSWYHTDALGSTQALSNSSQVTSDTYLYDAWGNPITSTGTTVNPFRWVGNVGYYFDSDTGLYYIRARTYQPTIARWTSADPLFYMLAKAGALGVLTRDPIGYEGSEWDLYEYCADNPFRNIDPSGNKCTLSNRDFPQTLPNPPNDPFGVGADDWKLGPQGTGQTYGVFEFSGKAECEGCYLEFEVVSRAGRYYRRKNGNFVDYTGATPPAVQDDPRNFAAFVIIKTCITSVHCVCGPTKNFQSEQLTTSLFYSANGLGTYIMWTGRGLRQADCKGATNYTTCDPGADHLACLISKTKVGDGTTRGSNGATE